MTGTMRNPVTGKVAPQATATIPLKSIDPDFDGDGQVTALEKEIYSKLVAADVDKSGHISTHELYGAIKELVESKKRTKAMGRLVVALIIALLLSLGAMFGVSVMAGEAIKESHVGKDGGSAMTNKDGKIVQVDTAESFVSFYDIATAPLEQLEYVKALNFAVDATTSPTYGGAWVPTVIHLAGALKPTPTTVILRSKCGATINIDQAQQTANIRFPDGTSLPADGAAPAPVARRLLEEKTSPVAAVNRRELLFGSSGSASLAWFCWTCG